MTPQSFYQNGEAEDVKGWFHAAALILTGVMAGYNLLAWTYRRERHLAVNAAIYTGAVLWELRQTMKHWR